MADKLLKKITITGSIQLESGLHIGGTNNAMAIGGPDSVVVRNPITNEPYIPGSSLKGKMRGLMELVHGAVKNVEMGGVKHGPSSDRGTTPAFLFGTATGNNETQRPSRVIVRDGELLNGEELQNTDLPFTESKTEVVIDRITSKAMPRQLERVPAGARFNLEMVLNVMESEKDREKELIDGVMEGLELVQEDYLGGHGSRGSGKVRFEVKEVKERPVSYYAEGKPADPKEVDVPDSLKADQ